ncbi:MAG: hypothetical protein AAFQ14_01060 [Cyanobacteria bacterium J06621_12]
MSNNQILLVNFSVNFQDGKNWNWMLRDRLDPIFSNPPTQKFHGDFD